MAATLVDARGSEFLGALDATNGQVITAPAGTSASLVALSAESTLDISGHASLTAFVVTGAATVPTLAFQGTVDGANYFTLPCSFPTGVVLQAASTTAVYHFPCAGYRRVRCVVTTAGTNPATVSMRASYAYVEPSLIPIMATGVSAATTLTYTTPLAGNFIWVKSVRLFVAAAAAQASAAVTLTNLPAGMLAATPALPAGANVEIYERDFQYRGIRCTAAGAATSIAMTPAAGNTVIIGSTYYVAGAAG